MNYLIQLFNDVAVADIIIWIAALGFLITVGIKGYKAITKFHDEIQDKEGLFTKMQESLQEITAKQNTLEDTIDMILENQEELRINQEAIEKEKRAHTLNKLRDRLLECHRYYTSKTNNPQAAWTELEKESFYQLYNDYLNYGGNGYVHSEIEPAMAALEIVKMTNQPRLNSLMNSRQG